MTLATNSGRGSRSSRNASTSTAVRRARSRRTSTRRCVRTSIRGTRAARPGSMWVEQVERLRVRFAASIGADADEIAVMPSASAGINAIASALSFAGPRSQVVIGDFEFPTMAQVWLAQERRGATDSLRACLVNGAGRAAARVLRRRDRRTHADRSRDARLLPERPQDRHRGLGAAGARPRRVRLPRRLPAHRLRSDRRARARRRLHGHRVPQVPARGGRHRISLRAPRSHRAARADGDRLVRPRQSVRVSDRRARLAVRRQPIRERHASGAERLRGARGVGPARPRRVRRDRPPGRPSDRQVRGRGAKPGFRRANSVCADASRPSRRRAERRRSRRWCRSWPRAASSPRAAATACACRSTPTTRTPTSTRSSARWPPSPDGSSVDGLYDNTPVTCTTFPESVIAAP